MTSSENEPRIRVNALGLLCPLPVFRAAQAVRSLNPGEIVEVLADDPGVVVDLPEWCAETGHELLEMKRLGGQWRLLIRRNADDAGPR